MNSKNIFGEPIVTCSTAPMTGYFRDGCCNTDETDYGEHTVCVIVTDVFLEFSKAQGNDLSTSRPEYGFQGLVSGDSWCLCATRFLEAYTSGAAPKVRLEATNEECLNTIEMDILIACAHRTV
ncbi:DUF2237 domain-containing protein [Cyclobacteriaceae bacterium]|nr:DUF2237 domain-containing protein [Cyclobacteriaceae bacterium]